MRFALSRLSTSRLSHLPAFLALQKSTIGLLIMVILVDMGERMGERFLPIYLMALGGGALSIGLLGAMDNLLSALYSFPGGYLSDRLGAKRSLAIFNLVAMIGFVIVIVVPTWQAVLAGAVFFISWSAISLPATMSLMFRVLPQNKRTMGVSMHSLVRRVPMALGPILGGVFIGLWGEQNGVRLAFGAALAMAAAALFMQQRLIEDDRPNNTSSQGGCAQLPEKNPLKLLRLMNPAMKGLLITDILVRFCEQIPYAFVVVWCMKVIEHPVTALQFGVLTSIEMATAVLVYVPVAYLADRSTKKPFVAITFRLLHPLSPVADGQPLLRDAGFGFYLEGAQGVRGTDPKSSHHGPGAGHLQGRDVRTLLPDKGRVCLHGRSGGRISVANQS
jgi:MFS family permease